MENSNVTTAPPRPEDEASGSKFLTFYLNNEEYGLDILKVREIVGLVDITPVPRVPDYIRGVINLRGRVVPVLDMRVRFGMEAVEATYETCIIVVQAAGLEMGLVVDRVSDVVEIAETDTEDVPDFGADIPTDYLLGVGKSDGAIRLLLDADRVLTRSEEAELQAAAAVSEGAAAETEAGEGDGNVQNPPIQ